MNELNSCWFNLIIMLPPSQTFCKRYTKDNRLQKNAQVFFYNYLILFVFLYN